MNDLLINEYTTSLGIGNVLIPCRCVTIETDSATQIGSNRDDVQNNLSINRIMPESIVNNFLQNNLNFDDTIVIYRDTDLQIQKIKNQILSAEHNFCVLFSMEKIIKEILLSYSACENISQGATCESSSLCDEPSRRLLRSGTVDGENIIITSNSRENIFRQIDLDFPRLYININHQKCKTKEDFIVFCAKYTDYKHPVMYNLAYLLLMLSTQASFYYPFNSVNDIYNSPDTGVYVTATHGQAYIDITENDHSLDITFRKVFRSIKIDTDETTNKFHTFMFLTIDLIEKQLFYFFNKSKYCECELGMMYWIKEM